MGELIIKFYYCVITRVPRYPSEGDGNMYTDFILKIGDEYVYNPCDDSLDNELIDHKKFIMIKSPNFYKSEILVLDGEVGREITGQGRKPSKWIIDYEIYDDADLAALRAIDLQWYDNCPYWPLKSDEGPIYTYRALTYSLNNK